MQRSQKNKEKKVSGFQIQNNKIYLPSLKDTKTISRSLKLTRLQHFNPDYVLELRHEGFKRNKFKCFLDFWYSSAFAKAMATCEPL